MTRLGKITGRDITTNKDGVIDRVMLQVQMTSPDDMQTVELVTLPGDDSNPINGSFVYVFTVAESYKIGFAIDDATPNMETGEKSIYAVNDAGALQCFIDLLKTGEIDIVGVAASIILLNSGIIEINGNADFAVRFNALETAFNTLRSDLNAHGHTDPQGGAVGPSLPVSTADISGAKVAEVKLP